MCPKVLLEISAYDFPKLLADRSFFHELNSIENLNLRMCFFSLKSNRLLHQYKKLQDFQLPSVPICEDESDSIKEANTCYYFEYVVYRLLLS